MILWTLFITFFKIGLFTFGGGYAMIPLIQSEIERHGWLSAEELINFIAVAESTPGPFAINIATYVGYVRRRVLLLFGVGLRDAWGGFALVYCHFDRCEML